MAKRFPLTKKAFKEYLQSNPRRKYTRVSAVKCPLAMALNSLAKGKDSAKWRVYSDYAFHGNSPFYARVILPKWAATFVNDYDNSSKRPLDLI